MNTNSSSGTEKCLIWGKYHCPCVCVCVCVCVCLEPYFARTYAVSLQVCKSFPFPSACEVSLQLRGPIDHEIAVHQWGCVAAAGQVVNRRRPLIIWFPLLPSCIWNQLGMTGAKERERDDVIHTWVCDASYIVMAHLLLAMTEVVNPTGDSLHGAFVWQRCQYFR